jgi:predicted small integral membrane protein
VSFRLGKIALVFALALFYFLVALDNLTDYDSNYQFVRHVLSMDSTFPGNHSMWRAISNPLWHTAFYLAIIAWELLTAVLLGWGAIRLARMFNGSAREFRAAAGVAITGLWVGLLMWLVAFLDVGGEWFLMWQSKTWNGQDVSVQMFTVLGLVLVLVALPEPEERK